MKNCTKFMALGYPSPIYLVPGMAKSLRSTWNAEKLGAAAAVNWLINVYFQGNDRPEIGPSKHRVRSATHFRHTQTTWTIHSVEDSMCRYFNREGLFGADRKPLPYTRFQGPARCATFSLLASGLVYAVPSKIAWRELRKQAGMRSPTQRDALWIDVDDPNSYTRLAFRRIPAWRALELDGRLIVGIFPSPNSTSSKPISRWARKQYIEQEEQLRLGRGVVPAPADFHGPAGFSETFLSTDEIWPVVQRGVEWLDTQDMARPGEEEVPEATTTAVTIPADRPDMPTPEALQTEMLAMCEQLLDRVTQFLEAGINLGAEAENSIARLKAWQGKEVSNHDE